VNPTDRLHLPVAVQTHPGESGKNNEDAASVSGHILEEGGQPSLLAIVADGVGGHRAGEIASTMAVDVVRRRVGESSGLEPLETLRAAIVEAGRSISTAAEALPERQGMASTIAVAWILGRRLFTAHAGDSRIYLLQSKRLHQITIDHSWVQEAIEHRIITPEEAPNHPHAHILRRYLGGNLEPQPDFRLRLSAGETDRRSLANQGLTLSPGDRILLCTDGLTDLVSNDEIAEAIGEAPPEEAASSLVVLARARGGHDNITTILIAVPPEAGPSAARPRRLALLLAVPLLVALVALAVAGLLWFGLWPW
jgi:protein phosphatase